MVTSEAVDGCYFCKEEEDEVEREREKKISHGGILSHSKRLRRRMTTIYSILLQYNYDDVH